MRPTRQIVPIGVLCLLAASGAAQMQGAPMPLPPPGVVSPAPPAPGGVAAPAPVAPVAVEGQEAAGAGAQTTLEDQTEVAVTIYNSNLALVRDRRRVTLPTGAHALRFMEVAQQIKPETVSLQSVVQPGSIAILEQNYEYDLISPQKLMEKYVGKRVRLVNFSTEIGFTEVDAELLSTNDGPIYRVGNEIYLGHPGTVVLPEIPGNLIPKPTLVWLIENDLAAQEIEATYLTNGMRWNADYVAKLDENEATMDLAGWVTLTNESGAQYTDAKLKLVAGGVNIVMPPPPPQPFFAGRQEMDMAAAAPMQEEAFAEYHLYTLPRPTTIKQNQTKQVSLLTATGIGVKKVYEFKGEVHFYVQIIPPIKDQKVGVYLEFQNEEKNALGMPLPGGIVRVYQEDSEGMLQFAGEDKIEHTPKDEEVRVRIGEAFDVVGERTQMDYRRIAENVHEAAFEIKIRNHKEQDIVVDVIEPMPSDWEILEKSHEFEKKDAFTAVFHVPVPKDGETVVGYRVRVRY